MKAFNRALDRFCSKHPRFGIPNLMLFIVIGNVVVYFFSMMDTTGTFLSFLYFNPGDILRGQIWRLITFVFIPYDSNIIWVALMLYFYYFIGNTLERQWGQGKFTIYYLLGIILTIIYGFAMWFIPGSENLIYLDASYINLSMFFAFATLYPDMQVRLFFIIPIKIKWLGILNAAWFLLAVIINPFPINLLPIIAILNYLFFCGGTLISLIKPSFRRFSKRTIDYNRTVKHAKKESGTKYERKCAVCGRSEADNPGLEFRYCSRCAGYHCFCVDHINNHEHFKS